MDLTDTIVKGRRVAATGTLISMTHAELAALVRRAGGRFVTYPRRGGLILVIGEDSLATDELGEPTEMLRRAQCLQAKDFPVRILREGEFLEQMGLVDAARTVHGLHSATDLVRLLNVTGARLRRWLRMGLIRPIEQIHGLPYFDFGQVASAKRLVELIEKGVTAQAIRQGLQRIEQWLPPHESAWNQLARLETDGRALVRINERLLDDRGQQYFDFESDEEHCSREFTGGSSLGVEAFFDAAIAFEDEGDLEKAAAEYRKALAIESDNSVLHFNYANVLFARHYVRESIQAYRRAIECDSCYVEAWNNLGSVLLANKETKESLECLNRALELNPSYADAHYNLAIVMDRLGRGEAAAHHRDCYRRFSSIARLQADRERFLRVLSPE